MTHDAESARVAWTVGQCKLWWCISEYLLSALEQVLASAELVWPESDVKLAVCDRMYYWNITDHRSRCQ